MQCICSVIINSAFLCYKLCHSVAELKHSASLKRRKQFGRTGITSLQGVSDSFGLEGSKCLGLDKDSWLQNYTAGKYKAFKQAVCLEDMLIFHTGAQKL